MPELDCVTTARIAIAILGVGVLWMGFRLRICRNRYQSLLRELEGPESATEQDPTPTSRE